MTYQLKGGEEIRDGKLFGWTGRDCAKCKGTAEDFSDANAPWTTCRHCGGTGEAWGEMESAAVSCSHWGMFETPEPDESEYEIPAPGGIVAYGAKHIEPGDVTGLLL